MLIRDILISALRRIGREDIAGEVEAGNTLAGEQDTVVQTLMYCINAAEDELARYYFPLKCTETLKSANNVFKFSSFSHTPVRIISVASGGGKIGFELLSGSLKADAKEIEVTYHYAPAKKTAKDESEFGDMGDGYITALGAAAEYCLICGEAAMAEVWEKKYREAIDRATRKIGSCAYMPPRRWI